MNLDKNKINTGINAIVKKNKPLPLFILSFIQTIYMSVYSLSLQNFLIYNRNMKPSIVGIIISASAIAYIFAPFLTKHFSNKIGIKNSLKIYSFSTFILIGIQLLIVDPILFIIIRTFSGLFMGLFWPNVLMQLSNWQKVIDEDEAKKNFTNFNRSWNFGLIFGYILGLTLVFIWNNDYIALVVSWIISGFSIPVSFYVHDEIKTKKINEKNREERSVRDFEKENIIIKKEGFKNVKNVKNLTMFPIFLVWVGIFFFTTSKSIFSFSLPFFLENAQIPSYFVYISTFFVQIFQVTTLNWINNNKPKNRLYLFFISSLLLILSSISIIIINEILFIGIISSLMGIFYGIILGFLMKIMLDKGTATGSNKYTTINETITGFGFGLTPIIAGFIIEINPLFNFYIIIFLGLITLIISYFLTKNIKFNDQINK